MPEPKSLKEKNAPVIWAVLILHVALVVLTIFGWEAVLSFDSVPFATKVQLIVAPTAIGIGLVSFTKLVLLGLVPDAWRDRLIHWRWKYPLPGSKAFSEIGPIDDRVDMEALTIRYGQLPDLYAEQNLLFYRIYREHRHDTGVLDAHRNYLAARDITTINMLMTVLLPFVALGFTNDFYLSFLYGCWLLALYAVGAIAAQTYAKRLVRNVLAAASIDSLIEPYELANSERTA